MLDDIHQYLDEMIADVAARPPRLIDTAHGPVAWLVPEYPPELPAPPSPSTVWWHGGPAIDGDRILPSHSTGNPGPHREGAEPLWPTQHDRRDVVHVTERRVLAAGYAALHDEPTLYRVAPLDWLALDPYYPPTGLGFLVCRTPAAVVLERIPLTRREADFALASAQAFEALALDRVGR